MNIAKAGGRVIITTDHEKKYLTKFIADNVVAVFCILLKPSLIFDVLAHSKLNVMAAHFSF